MMNALRTEKSKVEQKEDLAGIWMYGGMLVVFAGVVIETLPDFLGTSGVLRLAHRIGGGLVAGGLAVEFVVQLFASRYTGKLREINASIIADTLERTANAIERAANAEEAAADADLARIRLERRTAGRELSDEQRNAIAAKLSPFAGQRISIRAFPAVHEAIIFAHLIAMALNQAGWQVELLQSYLFTSPDGLTCSGLSLMSTPDEKSIAAGFALGRELAALADGIVGPLAVLPEPENPRLQLVVQGRDAPFRSEVK